MIDLTDLAQPSTLVFPTIAIPRSVLGLSVILPDLFDDSYRSEEGKHFPASYFVTCAKFSGGNRPPLIRFDQRDRIGPLGTTGEVPCSESLRCQCHPEPCCSNSNSSECLLPLRIPCIGRRNNVVFCYKRKYRVKLATGPSRLHLIRCLSNRTSPL